MNVIINIVYTCDLSKSTFSPYEMAHSFCDIIDKTIIETDLMNLTNPLSSLENDDFKYNLVITGTVGSGKSTLCEYLLYILTCAKIDVNTYPEFLYIDSNVSNCILRDKFDRKISLLTFQSYILDKWENILKINHNKKGVHIFERCVDDSVICFSNIANKLNDITDEELYTLFNRCKNINSRYDAPSYFNSNINFTELKSNDIIKNLNDILMIIIDDVHNKIETRIIGLSVSDNESKNRINIRNRNGELSYSEDVIHTYNKHYRRLYKYLNKNKKLTRYVDIGKLI